MPFGIGGTKTPAARAGASADDDLPRNTAGADSAPSLADERGIPAVNPRSYQSRGQLAAMVLGVGALLALMWAINRSPEGPVIAANDPKATKDQRFDEGRSSRPEMAPAAVKAAPAVPALTLEPPKPPVALLEPIQVVPKLEPGRAAGATTAPPPPTPLEKRMRSKTALQGDAAAAVVPTRAPASAQGIPGFPGLGRDGTVAPQTSGMAGAGGQGGPQGTPPSDEGGIGALLRPTRLQGAAAAKMADRRLMVGKGKMIDCFLDTAISTVVAGMVRCTIARDVYGDDGSVVLLDRGSELTGEYRSNLRPGQTRLGIVWDRAKTPNGVLIELGSPASDPLGRAGVDGYVETHFWERYGAAILLSSLDDALAMIANRTSAASGVFIPPNISRTGREASAVALEKNIGIPPTIIKNQGEHITIFVARDLDFRPVYQVRAPALTAHGR